MDADCKVALCREMTKTFETIYRMKVTDLIEHFKAHEDEIRGEFVLIVGPYEAKDDGDEISAKAKAALEKMISSLKVKEACQIVSDLTGESKNRLYDYALTLKDRS